MFGFSGGFQNPLCPRFFRRTKPQPTNQQQTLSQRPAKSNNPKLPRKYTQANPKHLNPLNKTQPIQTQPRKLSKTKETPPQTSTCQALDGSIDGGPGDFETTLHEALHIDVVVGLLVWRFDATPGSVDRATSRACRNRGESAGGGQKTVRWLVFWMVDFWG